MRAPEYQGSSFLGRISIRRNQVSNSMESNHDQHETQVLELFQKHVADRFSDLLPPENPVAGDPSEKAGGLLSIAWIRKLLDAYLCCEAEFKAILLSDSSLLVRPPMDRVIPEMLDRTVKGLDVLNAAGHGVDFVRDLQRSAEVAVSALLDRIPAPGEGRIQRSRKALAAVTAAASAMDGRDGPLRSSSMTVSKTWSATKQVQAMFGSLVPPRGADAQGLAQPTYIMCLVTAFTMWALAAAVPCQDRIGLGAHGPMQRNMGVWAQPILALQEKIADEWKRKEKKKGAVPGLMDELHRMERLSHSLVGPADSDKEEEMAARVAELAEVCRKMEEGLVPLQRQIREVFRRMVRSRTELLDILHHSGKISAAPIM